MRSHRPLFLGLLTLILGSFLCSHSTSQGQGGEFQRTTPYSPESTLMLYSISYMPPAQSSSKARALFSAQELMTGKFWHSDRSGELTRSLAQKFSVGFPAGSTSGTVCNLFSCSSCHWLCPSLKSETSLNFPELFNFADLLKPSYLRVQV